MTDWPHLLADLTAKRDALNHVIEVLTTQFLRDDTAPSAPPEERPRGARPRKIDRQKKRAYKRRTDGRTDGRSKARATSPGEAEPP